MEHIMLQKFLNCTTSECLIKSVMIVQLNEVGLSCVLYVHS